MDNPFKTFNIQDDILNAVKDLGYEKPTSVQQDVIPVVLSGRDVIVKSQTGSGKTAAFAIPICEGLDIEEKEPQALILTPTRELAVQVKADFTNIGRYKKIRCAAIFGKQPIQPQIRELKQRVHVVVGTPGRVNDHIERGSIALDKVRFLVLDEADEMLSMGFIEQVETIIKAVSRNRITMLFSATLPSAIELLCNKYMVDPVILEINPGKLTVDKTDQYYYQVNEEMKFEILQRILYMEKPDSCMIFCRTKDRVTTLASKLNQRDIMCMELHGGMLQDARLETMKHFKRGEFRILVATDVAARGIDVEEISHVINYDIPLEKESYVHRIGRTGRAENDGKAITMVTPYENKFLSSIEEYIEMSIPQLPVPSEEEAEDNKDLYMQKLMEKPIHKADKSHKLNKEIMKLYIHAGKSKKIRTVDIVGAISNIKGVEAGDIGIIDIQQDISYVDIMNGKGKLVLQEMQNTNIKGKPVRVERARK